MFGSVKKDVSGDSCVCTTGYKWSTDLQKCVCDPKQNFIQIGDVCKDCYAVPNSNGYASPFGCACKADYFWNPTTFECVVCSSASGHVLIDQICYSCDSATLPAGSTLTGCKACSNA
jgi:hypothetical protein